MPILNQNQLSNIINILYIKRILKLYIIRVNYYLLEFESLFWLMCLSGFIPYPEDLIQFNVLYCLYIIVKLNFDLSSLQTFLSGSNKQYIFA